MIRNNLAVITQEFRRHQAKATTTTATETTLEASQVKSNFLNSHQNIFKIFPSQFSTDVEIQKIRQDKINPAYSPAQSEQESPSKLSHRQTIKTNRGKVCAENDLWKIENVKTSKGEKSE